MQDGVPEQGVIHDLVLVPIHISRGGDSRPIDFRMPMEHRNQADAATLPR